VASAAAGNGAADAGRPETALTGSAGARYGLRWVRRLLESPRLAELVDESVDQFSCDAWHDK